MALTTGRKRNPDVERTERDIMTNLTKMGPLSFHSLGKLAGDRPLRVRYALTRLLKSGVVVVHERRVKTYEDSQATTVQVMYCLNRVRMALDLGATATPEASQGNREREVGAVTDTDFEAATCPACGRPRLGPPVPPKPERDVLHAPLPNTVYHQWLMPVTVVAPRTDVNRVRITYAMQERIEGLITGQLRRVGMIGVRAFIGYRLYTDAEVAADLASEGLSEIWPLCG